MSQMQLPFGIVQQSIQDIIDLTKQEAGKKKDYLNNVEKFSQNLYWCRRDIGRAFGIWNRVDFLEILYDQTQSGLSDNND